MKFRTRKLIKFGDLNARGTLFGGLLLKWIDEEAAIFAQCQSKTKTTNLVTKAMSELHFVSPANVGDIIEFGSELIRIGNTSISIKIVVRNKSTKKEVITVEKVTFVNVDEQGKPVKIDRK